MHLYCLMAVAPKFSSRNVQGIYRFTIASNNVLSFMLTTFYGHHHFLGF
jgi:hypothetical protein